MKTCQAKDEIYNYIIEYGCNVSDVKLRLREETNRVTPSPIMMTSIDQSELLKMIVKLTSAKKGIEVGTFTGYSALCIAEALPEDGKLVCLDICTEFTDIGEKYWKEAGVDSKIDLRIAPAADTLDSMIDTEGELESYDFAFIDADKEAYLGYYERLLKLLKPNGYIVLDNYLINGDVVGDIDTIEEPALSMRKLAEFIKTDERVEQVTIPIADGVSIVRKK